MAATAPALKPGRRPADLAAPAAAATVASQDEAAAEAPCLGALRFLTAGSVDDGKSTLIGRLLYDSRAILADQLAALQARSAGDMGNETPDLSLLTDGLEAEREQGITIDVAYRYFATRRRKFIIADAPGHEQYTRNMVTAAAGSDAAVVLVDLTKLDLGARPVPLLPQTRRHALLARLLRVPHIVFAINKIDAVAEPGRAFAAVRDSIERFAAAAGIVPAGILPVSALRGDNIALTLRAPWYRGPTLLRLLEGLPAAASARASMPGAPPAEAAGAAPLAMAVQYVARGAAGTADGITPGAPSRTYWGRIAQGRATVGAEVQVFPSGERARIAALRHAGRAAQAVDAGFSAGLVLDRQLDISRGDWLAAPGSQSPTNHFEATLAWLDIEAAVPGRRYWVRHAQRWVPARLERIDHRLDIDTLQPVPSPALGVNQIGRVVVRLQQPLPLQPFAESQAAGALIVVDPATHRTSGALLVEGTDASGLRAPPAS